MSEDDFLWPPETFEANDDPALASKLGHAMDIIFAQFRRLRDDIDAIDTSGSGGSTTPHAILSATHSDVTVAAAANGDLLLRSGGAWVRLPVGAAGQALIVVGTAPTWSNDGSALTGVPVTAHNLLSATHGDTTAAAAVLGDIISAQRAAVSDSDAYWFDGQPFEDLDNANDAGTEGFWFDGQPAVGLGSVGTTKWARKANGTPGQVLTAGATGPDWAAAAGGGSGASVYRAADLAIAAATTVILDTVTYDDGYWSSGNPTRLTVPTGSGGTFLVIGAATVQSAYVGGFWLSIYVNGIERARHELNEGNTTAPYEGNGQVSAILRLNATDYVELVVEAAYSGVPVAVTVKGGSKKTYLQMARL